MPASMRTFLSSHPSSWLRWPRTLGGPRARVDVEHEACKARLMHPDPRPGCDERSSQGSDELPSVQSVCTPHHKLNAREAHWQTPINDAPLLNGRSLCRDPRTLRARRPWTMMLQPVSSYSRICRLPSSDRRLEHSPGGDLAVLQIAPQRDRHPPGQRHDAHPPRAFAPGREAPVEPLCQLAVGLQAKATPMRAPPARLAPACCRPC